MMMNELKNKNKKLLHRIKNSKYAIQTLATATNCLGCFALASNCLCIKSICNKIKANAII